MQNFSNRTRLCEFSDVHSSYATPARLSRIPQKVGCCKIGLHNNMECPKQLYLIKEADNGFVAIQVLLDVKKRSRDKIDIDFFKN